MVDLRQTKAWAEYLQSWGWQVENINCRDNDKARIFIRKFSPFPVSFFKFQRYPGKPDEFEISSLKNKHRTVYSIIEPNSKVGILPGYKICSSYYIPSKTIILDLSLSEKTLFNNFSENAKRILHQNSSIKISETDLKTFYPAWKSASKIYVPPFSRINTLLNVFSDKAKLFISHDNKKMHSGLLLLCSPDTANYFYTWTNSIGRSSNAHYHLVWQAIIAAKEMGLKYFDFEGVFDSRFPNKNWLGFSEFKNKFGGKTVTYPGCFGRWF
jgi:lipid II:glycine glycyltransferase (peptidoglycan interpeptide bridge formation enzyme)